MIRVTTFLQLLELPNSLIAQKGTCGLSGGFAVLGKVKTTACTKNNIIELLQHFA